jgi:adenine-specific DNA-methyltransferase
VQVKQISESAKLSLIDKYMFATGRINLFYFFIEITPQLAKAEAITAYIIPDRLLLNTQCKEIREWLLKEQTIVELSSFDESVFESAVVDTIIMMYKNVNNHRQFLYSRPNLKLSELENNVKRKIPFSHFELSSNKQFDINFDESKSKIVSKIRNGSKLLEEVAETKDGIIQSKIPDILFLKEQKNKYCKPLLFGKDINRYELNYNDNWVNYQPDKMMEVELERNGGGLRLRKK